MDDGLLSKPKSNPPTDDSVKPADDQKKIDEAVNQLPKTPTTQEPPKEEPSISPAPTPTPTPTPTTPTPTPPTAPVASVPPELITTPVTEKSKVEPEVPAEKPEINKPPNKLKMGMKKNGKKIVGGMLVLALLVGGAYIGTQQIQKRQTVESEAYGSDYKDCASITKKSLCTGCDEKSTKDNGWRCNWVDGECKAIIKNTCKRSETTTNEYPDGEIGCITWAEIMANKCTVYYCPGVFTYGNGCQKNPGQLTKTQVQNGAFCGLVQIDCPDAKDTSCTSIKFLSKISRKTCDEPSTPSSSPSPSPSASPSPTPTPSPEITCIDLTSDPADIELDDVVTFTCEGSFSSVTAPVAFFRYNIDGGTYTESAAIAVDTTTNLASYDVTVDEYGDWNVQCRVCEDSTATSCTTWGEAN